MNLDEKKANVGRIIIGSRNKLKNEQKKRELIIIKKRKPKEETDLFDQFPHMNSLNTLLKDPNPPKKDVSKSKKKKPKNNTLKQITPIALAKRFKGKRNAFIKDNIVYLYNKKTGIYEIQNETMLSQKVESLLSKKERKTVAMANIKEAAKHLLKGTYLEQNDLEYAKPHLVCCKNGIFDAKTNKFFSHSPTHIFTDFIRACWNDNPMDGNFSRYIKLLTKENKEVENLLAEWTGCMIGNISVSKKAAFLLSASVEYISPYLNLLASLIGEENIFPITFTDLFRSKNPEKFLTKTITIVTNFPDKPIVDTAFLNYLLPDFDLLQPLKSQRICTKFFFWANSLPTFASNTEKSSSDFLDNILIIPLADEIKNNKAEILQNVLEEKEAMLNWALNGLSRYVKNNAFTSCAVSDELAAKHKIKSNIFTDFATQNLVAEEGKSLFVEEIYQRFEKYSKSYGGCQEKNKHALIKKEIENTFSIACEKFRKDGSSSKYGYKNITFKE